MKKTIKIIGWSILACICLYFGAVWLLPKITHHSELIKNVKEINIYIKSNGVHTDIVMPVKNKIYDWSKHIKYKHTKSKDSLVNYVAVGWGDKGFYLDTPT